VSAVPAGDVREITVESIARTFAPAVIEYCSQKHYSLQVCWPGHANADEKTASLGSVPTNTGEDGSYSLDLHS